MAAIAKKEAISTTYSTILINVDADADVVNQVVAADAVTN